MNQLALDLQPAPQEYRITLSRGLFAIVDEADFGWLSEFNWYAQWSPTTKSFYAKRNIKLSDGKRTTRFMHREIMNANGPSEQVDHENHNTLDNRRSVNLRLSSNAQNGWNRGASTKTAHGCKGVHFDRINNQWRAQIRVNGKRLHLGRFDTAEGARRAYENAARELHGEFIHSSLKESGQKNAPARARE